MDIDKFAMTVAACKAVESGVDKNGNTISGSKKAAILSLLKKLNLTNSERVIIMAYLGYGVSEYEDTIKSYVSRLGLSKSQQISFLKYCDIKEAS